MLAAPTPRGATPCDVCGMRAMHRCVIHSFASIGRSAAPVEMVIPVAPATMPSKARSDAVSLSATVDREVATAPQIAAVTPSAKLSSTSQNTEIDSAPMVIDAVGSRESCCVCVSLRSTEGFMGFAVRGLRGMVAVMFLLRG